MRLREFVTAIRGNRRLRIQGDPRRPLTASEFYHLFRNTYLWEKEVDEIYTTVVDGDCIVYEICLRV